MAYFDPAEEALSADEIVALQRRKFAAMLPVVRATNHFYQHKLPDRAFDPERDAMDRLPFTTRAELEDDQARHPVYGTNLTYPLEAYARFHQTSGSRGTPLRWLDTRESWQWWGRCWGIIFTAAGLTSAQRVLFPFAFGPFIGFWGAFDSAQSLGHLCFAAGGMSTVARLRLLLDNAVTVVCCTPTYALHMAEVAAQEGLDLAASTVRALIVAGEPGGNISATRRRIEESWGARVFDHPGMTEVGAWGFECEESPTTVHVMESDFIAEVVDPKTDDVSRRGEIGELVLTNLGRWGSPVIRYRTGDLVRLIHGRCACGRWFARLEGGILGRVDDMLVLRGHNVFPSAVENVVREFDEVAEFRLNVVRRGAMSDLEVVVEIKAGRETVGLSESIRSRIRDRLHFSPRVTIAATGSLPRFEMKAKRLVVREEG